MKIKEFEKEIQKEIDSNLTIRPNTNTTDVSGVYIGNAYLGIALPQKEIMPKKSEFFMDKNGTPFRGQKEAKRDIRAKLSTISQEKYDLLTEDYDPEDYEGDEKETLDEPGDNIAEVQDDDNIVEVQDDDDDMIIT